MSVKAAVNPCSPLACAFMIRSERGIFVACRESYCKTRDARERRRACYSPNESFLFLFLSFPLSALFCISFYQQKAWAHAPSFVMLLIMKENCEAIKFHPRRRESPRRSCRYFLKKRELSDLFFRFLENFWKTSGRNGAIHSFIIYHEIILFYRTLLTIFVWYQSRIKTASLTKIQPRN